MSIYVTIFGLDGDPDSAPGRVSAYTDNAPLRIPGGIGNWRTHVGLANIPGYCWPVEGGGEDADVHPDAPWLRLSVSAGTPDHVGDWPWAAVLIDVEAARSLRDALTDWIDTEHLPDLTDTSKE